MEYSLPPEERAHLRKLAKRQAEIANLPVMQVRRNLWTDTNDAVPGSRPPFAIETWTFDRDFMPSSIFQCQSQYGRRLEGEFLRHIRQFEILNDDHVCPDTLDMAWHVWQDEFGIEIGVTSAKDAEGVDVAYHFDCPIKDLRSGFDMLKPATFGVYREETLAEKQFLEEAFGDILPVVIRSGTFGSNYLTSRLMPLMSMETFLLAMYDCPDKLQGIMALIRDNAIRMSRWAEQEGLLVINNGNQTTCDTCYNFTTLLPKRPVEPGKVKLSDMWSSMNSQETIGVSPEFFHELIFPHYAQLAEMFGLVYWGCCEPAHPIWEKSLSKLPKLKAVSISRWCDECFMAEALDGKGIVYSRKPNPNILGVGRSLDEDAWRKDIRDTLDVTKGRNIPLEFVVRDVYSVHGDLGKPRRAVELSREEIDRVFGHGSNA
jgi:hypothetical protein